MHIHDQIRTHLELGDAVYSFAAGRVGRIVEIDTHPLFPVVIQSMRGRRKSATTFSQGDKVKLVERENYKGQHCWAVVNDVE